DEKGRRLTIIFEIDQARAVFLYLFQLVIPMFQAVGIDAQMRSMDRSLWETRVRQGRDFDSTAHQFGMILVMFFMLFLTMLYPSGG
ncbi:hypothetical protein ACC809_36630, partial [Rhizobium johnstonii]